MTWALPPQPSKTQRGRHWCRAPFQSQVLKGGFCRAPRHLLTYGFPVTAAVAPAGREEQYGSYVGVDEGYHRRETIAAAAAAAAVYHRRGTSVAAATAGMPLSRDQCCCSCSCCRGMLPPPTAPPSQKTRPTTRAWGCDGRSGNWRRMNWTISDSSSPMNWTLSSSATSKCRWAG